MQLRVECGVTVVNRGVHVQKGVWIIDNMVGHFGATALSKHAPSEIHRLALPELVRSCIGFDLGLMTPLCEQRRVQLGLQIDGSLE